MQVKDILEKLRESDEFKEWHKKYPDRYLVHMFVMVDDAGENWQIGYYDSKENMITTFSMAEKIVIEDFKEHFSKEKKLIKKLDESKIKIDLKEALGKAEELQKTKYSADMPVKKIVIIQNIEEKGHVYNITYVTRSMKTLNIKINTESGDIIFEELVSLMQFPSK